MIEQNENRDDDGERGAADKLLFLLQQCNLENILIVVTRWYGGIHLGTDRYFNFLAIVGIHF